MRQQKGFSLVELMISITIGLILLTGVMQVFLSSKATYSTQQALSRVQETGRLAVDFLARDIRMAGYMGCASRAATMSVSNTLNTPTAFDFDFGTAVMGYPQAATPGPVLPASLSALTHAPLANTDIIVLRSAAGNGVQIVDNNNDEKLFASYLGTEAGACKSATNVISDSFSGLCNGDILVVADCVKARVFQATNIQYEAGRVNIEHVAAGTPGNADASWGGASDPEEEKFGPGAEILSATSTAYFIATTAGTSGRPSLWQKVNNSTALELLEGVENISIKYGVDTTPAAPANRDFIPDRYALATEVTPAEWKLVVAVRFEILVASIDNNVLPEMQKYRFNGVDDISPNPVDRRLRQVFTSTVGIRSRLY